MPIPTHLPYAPYPTFLLFNSCRALRMVPGYPPGLTVDNLAPLRFFNRPLRRSPAAAFTFQPVYCYLTTPAVQWWFAVLVLNVPYPLVLRAIFCHTAPPACPSRCHRYYRVAFNIPYIPA